jgi:hypothetical protein
MVGRLTARERAQHRPLTSAALFSGVCFFVASRQFFDCEIMYVFDQSRKIIGVGGLAPASGITQKRPRKIV